MDMSRANWIIAATVISGYLCCIFTPVSSDISLLNTPPVIYVDRNWRMFENEEVGSMIARVQASDAESDALEFDLELPNINYGESKGKLPFRIDSRTGNVYLNESIDGRGGESFFLYVTVSDGKLTAKTEVYVNIFAQNDTSIYNSRTPSFSQQAKDFSKLFPPYHLLPVVHQFQQQNKQQNQNIPPVPPNIQLPNYATLNNRHPPPPSTYLNQTVVDLDDDMDDIDDDSETLNPVVVSDNTSKTFLTAVKNNSTPLGDNKSKNKIPEGITNSSTTSPSLPKDGGSSIDITPETYTIKAVMPVIITVCGIFLAAGVIALFIYRKHLCAIGRSLKKKSKEEMAKKSNQSNLSSNITEDSRNSMVLQHWNGPMAFSNRYVPWERENQQQHTLATSQLSTSGSTGGNQQSKTDRWEFPRHRLKFFNILGEGAFGQVWRCEATNIDGVEGVTTVAVKTLKENATEVERNDLYSELQVMKSLEPHVNVVRLLGCCTDKDPVFVIIEYVNRGKLQTYLRKSRAERHYGNTHGKSNVLTSGDLTSFMYQVARGMDFLTSRGIIHRDLAARNILITDDHTCKVADFGFARDIITSKVYERKSEGKLPIRWMAIESLYDNIFSVKSDIWSFGILMWEIVTLGSTPYPGISAADVMKKVRDGYRLEKPEHCRRELYNIMYYCWAKDPNERPSFSEVVQLLDKLLLTETDYIELEHFPDHNYYNMLSLSGEKL